MSNLLSWCRKFDICELCQTEILWIIVSHQNQVNFSRFTFLIFVSLIFVCFKISSVLKMEKSMEVMHCTLRLINDKKKLKNVFDEARNDQNYKRHVNDVTTWLLLE